MSSEFPLLALLTKRESNRERQARYRQNHPDREKARQASKRDRSVGQKVVNAPCLFASDGNCKGRVEAHHKNGYAPEHWYDTDPLCDFHHTRAEQAARK